MIDLQSHGGTAAMSFRTYKGAAAVVSFENLIARRDGDRSGGLGNGRALMLSALSPLFSPLDSFRRIFAVDHEVHRQLEELLERCIRR